MSNLVRGSRFSITLFKTGQSSSVNACKHWNCNCYPNGTLNIQRAIPNMLSASWQSTGKCFFLVGGRACKSFSHKGKEDVHGSEDHYSSINQEGKAEDKAAREPFLFTGHICLCSQISTLRESPSSLLDPLNAEGRHKTPKFLEAFS